MTWKDALIKLESTINFYNYQIQSLKIENEKLSKELKELKETFIKLQDFCNNILDKFYEDEIEVYDALNQINKFMKEQELR